MASYLKATARIDDGLTAQQRYYQRHKDKVLTYNRAYYARNRQKLIAGAVAYGKKRRAADKTWNRQSAAARREIWLRRYGLTSLQYAQKITSQGGKCLICTSPFGIGLLKPVVDHCHASGKVRGILCVKCNVGLGNFLDCPDTVTAAANYLRSCG